MLYTLCILFPSEAQVTMPKFFSDNMVLQRDKPIHIWGHSSVNEKIEVHFKGQNKKTTATGNGS
jgi:sialate O-acetylesterase